jgi:hypothetical protein
MQRRHMKTIHLSPHSALSTCLHYIYALLKQRLNDSQHDLGERVINLSHIFADRPVEARLEPGYLKVRHLLTTAIYSAILLSHSGGCMHGHVRLQKHSPILRVSPLPPIMETIQ